MPMLLDPCVDGRAGTKRDRCSLPIHTNLSRLQRIRYRIADLAQSNTKMALKYRLKSFQILS